MLESNEADVSDVSDRLLFAGASCAAVADRRDVPLVRHAAVAAGTSHTFAWSGVEVTVGVFDDAVFEAFTEGECASFARAVRDRFGGVVCAVYDGAGVDERVLSHFVVRLADDRYADVEGVCSEAALVERWSVRLDAAVVTVDEFELWPPVDDTERVDVAVAASFVDLAAERFGW